MTSRDLLKAVRPKCPTCNLRLRDGRCVKSSCRAQQLDAIPQSSSDADAPSRPERTKTPAASRRKPRERSRSVPTNEFGSNNSGGGGVPQRPASRHLSPREHSSRDRQRSPRGARVANSGTTLSLDMNPVRSRGSSPRSSPRNINRRSPRSSPRSSDASASARRSPRSPRGSPRVSAQSKVSPRGSPRSSDTRSSATRSRRASSLVKLPCGECGEEIRSRAAVCIHCGAHTQSSVQEAARIPQGGSKRPTGTTSTARSTRRLDRSQTMGNTTLRKNCQHCSAVIRSKSTVCSSCGERQVDLGQALADVQLEDSRNLDSMVAFMTKRKEVVQRNSGGTLPPATSTRSKSSGNLRGRGRGTRRDKPLPQSSRSRTKGRGNEITRSAPAISPATAVAVADADEDSEDIFAFDLGQSMDMNIGVSSSDGIHW